MTPAGQALVNAGLFSRTQLLQLDADSPVVATAPPGNVSLVWLRTFDVTLARPLKLGDHFVLEPSVSAFNILNFANFDGPGNRLSGALTGSAGSVNGTTVADRAASRIGPGFWGVFAGCIAAAPVRSEAHILEGPLSGQPPVPKGQRVK